MRGWHFDPQSGGDKIPPDVQEKTRSRILVHAKALKPEKAGHVRVRFKGQFCYIDEQERTEGPIMPLCRLRYFKERDRFSLGFFTYSNERYEPCVFRNGDWLGTPEEAFEIGMMYLD